MYSKFEKSYWITYANSFIFLRLQLNFEIFLIISNLVVSSEIVNQPKVPFLDYDGQEGSVQFCFLHISVLYCDRSALCILTVQFCVYTVQFCILAVQFCVFWQFS